MNAPSTRLQPYVAEIDAAKEDFEAIAATNDGHYHLSYAKEAGFAKQAFAKSEQLQKCSPFSIRDAIVNVAAIGLTLNPATKLAYLVPRKGQCCLDISYQGLIKIAVDSGSILAVAAEIVRANDEYIPHGPFALPEHKFNPFAPDAERGDIVGVYVAAKLASGGYHITTLNREDIDQIRDASKAASGPWVEWFPEMCKKAGIKRAQKLWPNTERLALAAHILNEHEGLVGPEDRTPSDAAPAESRVEAAKARMKRGAKSEPTQGQTYEGEAHRVPDAPDTEAEAAPTVESARKQLQTFTNVPDMAKYMSALPADIKKALSKDFNARRDQLKQAA